MVVWGGCESRRAKNGLHGVVKPPSVVAIAQQYKTRKKSAKNAPNDVATLSEERRDQLRKAVLHDVPRQIIAEYKASVGALDSYAHKISAKYHEPVREMLLKGEAREDRVNPKETPQQRQQRYQNAKPGDLDVFNIRKYDTLQPSGQLLFDVMSPEFQDRLTLVHRMQLAEGRLGWAVDEAMRNRGLPTSVPFNTLLTANEREALKTNTQFKVELIQSLRESTKKRPENQRPPSQ